MRLFLVAMDKKATQVQKLGGERGKSTRATFVSLIVSFFAMRASRWRECAIKVPF
jgi:hypothetical protein